MSHLVANLPPIHCYIRKEFLYNFKKGHREYEHIERLEHICKIVLASGKF